MGILRNIAGDIVGEIAEDLAADAGLLVLGAAAGAVKGVATLAGGASELFQSLRGNDLARFQEKMTSKNPDNCHVWMMEDSRQMKKSFLNSTEEVIYQFVNDDGNILYNAVYEKNKDENFITLYDAYDHEIAGIAQRITKQRNAFAVKSNEKSVDLEMFFKQEAMGTVTNNVWKGDRFLEWDIVKWGAKRKKFGGTLIVGADDSLIAEITSKPINNTPLTFLDVENHDQETAVVLFALAIVAYDDTK